MGRKIESMARRDNLKELLKQEQEPFHVQSRGRHQHNSKQNASFPSTFSRNACLCSSSSTSSPAPFKNCPLLSSPATENNNNSNHLSDALFLHVPPKTSALLLEAALRVHNHVPKSKTRIPNSGLGSLIKKLIRIRTRIPKTPDNDDDDDDVVKWAASAKTSVLSSSLSSSSSSSSSFCSTHSSGTGSIASRREEGKPDQARFLKGLETEYAASHGGLPFGDLQENFHYERTPPLKSLGEEHEEDREQNSPVSILDPPFDDDNESCEDTGDQFQTKDGEFNLECSYAFLQRAKRRLCLNSQSFENLAELETTKLEDRTVAEEDFPSAEHKFDISIEDVLVDVACETSLIKDFESPWLKRLVADMIREERISNCRSSSGDLKHNQLIVKRVCKRLDSWPDVEAHTIDMMIDMDFREEGSKWKKHEDDDESCRAVIEVECSIYSGLIEELLDEFVSALD